MVEDTRVITGEKTPPSTTEPVTINWRPGRIVAGRYIVRRIIGAGGMGIVALADDVLLRKKVAVKALRPAVARQRKHVERFRKEVALAHSITHPNIARTYDLGEDHDIHYFSMEFIDGTPLSQSLNEKKTLSPHQVRDIGVAVCRALEAAHAANVVHRDMKPSNIMLVPDARTAIVMDFGISGVVQEARDVSLDTDDGDEPHTLYDWDVTSIGMGTPKYMSPEQWLGKPVGPPSDVYALGAILFQCLVGKAPFQAKDDDGFAQAHVYEEAPRVRSLIPKAPRDLDRTIARCLEKHPDNRFQSAAELRLALSRQGRWPRVVQLLLRVGLIGVVIAALGWGSLRVAESAIIHEMRPAVERLAQLVAQNLPPEEMDRFSRAEDVYLPEYEHYRRYLERVRDENPDTLYLYVFRRLDEPGQFEFVLDRDPFPDDANNDGVLEGDEQGGLPGRPYDGSRFAELVRCAEEGVVTSDEAFTTDEYATVLSGYAPIGERRGEGAYLVGVDVDNSRITAFRKAVFQFCIVAWLALVLIPSGLVRRPLAFLWRVLTGARREDAKAPDEA